MDILRRIFYYYSPLLVCLAGISLSTKASIDPDSNWVIVITAANRPLQHIDQARSALAQNNQRLVVYLLSAIETLENSINQTLPNNEAQARIAFQQYLQKIGKENFHTQVLQAYQGVFLALQYQLDRYPAIIFDRRYVIYGLTDLALALQKYREWRNRRNSNEHQ